MQLNDCKEEFSYAHIQAIASASGLVIEKKPRPIDNQGIDITIQYPGEIERVRMPRIDAQVKCTAQDVLKSDEIVYDLPIKNYDSLRTTESFVPQILILVLVPQDLKDWVAVNENETLLKKCSYWFSMRGEPSTTNQHSISIKIPRSNLLTPDLLKELIERVPMKIPTVDITAYNGINLQKIFEYLEGKGWQESERFEDKAVIFELARAEHNYSVLLPLRTNLSDYNSRMYEAFRALEIIENRSQLDLFNDFLDARFIAKETQREIINFRLESASFTEEASAKYLGMILESTQEIYDKIGHSIHQRNFPMNGSKRISQDVLNKTKITILGTFRGSLGIRLALPPQGQLELNDFPLGYQVTEYFMDIISSSEHKKFNELSSKLSFLQRRTVQKFRKFLFALLDAKTNIQLEWGSPYGDKGGSVNLSFSSVTEVINFINELDFSSSEIYELTGELVGINKRSHQFEFWPFEGEKIIGTIEPTLFSEGNVDMIIGKIYKAVIEETNLIDKSQEEKTQKKLLNLCPI